MELLFHLKYLKDDENVDCGICGSVIDVMIVNDEVKRYIELLR